jgi:hypothetical protein
MRLGYGLMYNFGIAVDIFTLKMATEMFAKRWVILNIRRGSHLKAEVTTLNSSRGNLRTRDMD